MEGNDCNKAIKIVTALAIIMFIFGASALLTINSLKTENAQLKEDYIKLVNESAECSPLGICIGDYVEQTNEAKRLHMTISGVVVKVINDNLIIDTGNENWQAVNEMWVRHSNTIKEEPEYKWETLPTPSTTTTKSQSPRWVEGEPAPEKYQYYENYYKRSEEKVYQCEKPAGTNRSESDRCWFIGWR